MLHLICLPHALVHLRKLHTVLAEIKPLPLLRLPIRLNTTSLLVLIALHLSQLALQSVQNHTHLVLILAAPNVIQAHVHLVLLKSSGHVDVVQPHALFDVTRYIKTRGRKPRRSYVTGHVLFFALVGRISAGVFAVPLPHWQ